MPGASVTVTGLEQAILWLEHLHADVDLGREDALVGATSAVGEVWKRNFQSEGGNNSPWDGLSELTQAIRAAEGYDPEHPILRRTGDLEQAAVDFIVSAQPGSMHQVEGAEAHIDYSDGVMVLSLAGVKVENQWGNSNHNLPARPFWYTDSAVEEAAQKAVVDWLEGKLR